MLACDGRPGTGRDPLPVPATHVTVEELLRGFAEGAVPRLLVLTGAALRLPPRAVVSALWATCTQLLVGAAAEESAAGAWHDVGALVVPASGLAAAVAGAKGLAVRPLLRVADWYGAQPEPGSELATLLLALAHSPKLRAKDWAETYGKCRKTLWRHCTSWAGGPPEDLVVRLQQALALVCRAVGLSLELTAEVCGFYSGGTLWEASRAWPFELPEAGALEPRAALALLPPWGP